MNLSYKMNRIKRFWQMGLFDRFNNNCGNIRGVSLFFGLMSFSIEDRVIDIEPRVLMIGLATIGFWIGTRTKRLHIFTQWLG